MNVDEGAMDFEAVMNNDKFIKAIDEAVFIKSEEDETKIDNLILLSDNLELFKKYSYNYIFNF